MALLASATLILAISAGAPEPPKPSDAGVTPADPKGYAAAIAQLEGVYTAQPMPELLLNVAALYQLWDGHCSEALETYRRFFTACTGCSSLSYATERFDAAIDRCIEDPEQEIAIREKFMVPAAELPQESSADATREEVVDLLHEVERIDRGEASLLFVSLAEGNLRTATLNHLRSKAWLVLKRAEATHSQVFALLQRIKRVDLEKYQEMLSKLSEAESKRDQGALNLLRLQGIGLLEQRVEEDAARNSPVTGCRANPKREWGFITIDTTPWSTVFVNGKKHGSTPISRVEVLAGCASIRVVDSGSGKEVVKNVTIRPNLNAILTIDLAHGTERFRYD